MQTIVAAEEINVQSVYVFDWDQTLCKIATNNSVLCFGLKFLVKDRVSAEKLAEKLEQIGNRADRIEALLEEDFSRQQAESVADTPGELSWKVFALNRLQPGSDRILEQIVERNGKIVIASNHVFPEVILHHLRAILTEDEIRRHVQIKTASPDHLAFNSRYTATDDQNAVLEIIRSQETAAEEKIRQIRALQSQNCRFVILSVNDKNSLIMEDLNLDGIKFLYYFDDNPVHLQSFEEYISDRKNLLKNGIVITRLVVEGFVKAGNSGNGSIAVEQPLMEFVRNTLDIPHERMDLSLPGSLAPADWGIIHTLLLDMSRGSSHESLRLKKCGRLNPVGYPLTVDGENRVYYLSHSIVFRSGQGAALDQFRGCIILNQEARGLHGKFKHQFQFCFDNSTFLPEGSSGLKIVKLERPVSSHNWRQIADSFVREQRAEAELFFSMNTAGRTHAPYIIDLDGIGIKICRYYQPMPVLGKSLQQMLEDDSWAGLVVEKKIQIQNMILQKVQALHDAGWVHHDLSLRNIVYNSEQETVYLIDFGHAEKLGSTKCMKTGGDRFYMPTDFDARQAPEPRYDMYSLAGILGMLSGQPRSTIKLEKAKKGGYTKPMDDGCCLDSEEKKSDQLPGQGGYKIPQVSKDGYTEPMDDGCCLDSEEEESDQLSGQGGYEISQVSAGKKQNAPWNFSSDQFEFMPIAARENMQQFLNSLAGCDNGQLLQNMQECLKLFETEVVSKLVAGSAYMRC